MKTPNAFFDWAYSKRKELLEKILNESFKDEQELFIGFTRHTPVMITNGSAGLNGSVKGFGFVPKAECIDEVTAQVIEVIKLGKSASYKQRIQALLDMMYSEKAIERIDFTRLVSLELARKHTWENVGSENVPCTLVYYEPPMISFEIRGKVSLELDGKYTLFANAMHDVYHAESSEIRKLPAYIFEIGQIFDNSVRAFGKELKSDFDNIGIV